MVRRRIKMDYLSLITKISFIGTIIFGLLWLLTPKNKVYETVEMETVSTRKIFSILAIVCFGFLLASIFIW
jgi:hypothetical protein